MERLLSFQILQFRYFKISLFTNNNLLNDLIVIISDDH